jgi:hypothetical protein
VRQTWYFRRAINQQNPVKAGPAGTSDAECGPAKGSVSVTERAEPMADALSRGSSPMRKWARWSKDLWSAASFLRGVNRGPKISDTSFRHKTSGNPVEIHDSAVGESIGACDVKHAACQPSSYLGIHGKSV